VPLRRGVRQDGRGRDGGVRRRRRAHHRHAFAVARGLAPQPDQRCWTILGREQRGEHQPALDNERIKWVSVLEEFVTARATLIKGRFLH
jgi:hypothetical protein